jgi:hypothetical protein
VNPALQAYLEAPEEVRAAFDRELVRAVRAQTDERRYEAALDDSDPVPPALPADRPQPIPRWTWRWQIRAARPAGTRAERDYGDWIEWLASLDLVEIWTALTGDDSPAGRAVRCPLPDHDDADPSCYVYADTSRGWFCFGCQRGGSALDLGAILWQIEPRGAGFFEICRRLDALT